MGKIQTSLRENKGQPEGKAKPENKSGRTAQWIIHRLPPELWREVYRYTLTAKRTVGIRENDPDLPYKPQERDKGLNEDLKRAMSFHFKGTHASLALEAEAFFLEQNTFVICTEKTAEALVEATNRLKDKGCTVHIGHVRVRVPPPTPMSGRDYDSDGPGIPYPETVCWKERLSHPVTFARPTAALMSYDCWRHHRQWNVTSRELSLP